MTDKEFLNKLRIKQLEVASIPPQNLGVMDLFYKDLSLRLKIAPWKIIIPTSILLIILFKLTTNVSLVKLVSILQEGF